MDNKKTPRTLTRLSSAALLGSALMFTGIAGTNASTTADYYNGDADALVEQLEHELVEEDQVNGEHIGLSSASSDYLLAPNQSAYWTVSVNSLTGLDAEAIAGLYVSGTFDADVTVVDVDSNEVLLNDNSADLDGTVDFDEFNLVDGRDYLIEVQADEDAPQLEDIDLELTVHAEGETIQVTPPSEEPPVPPAEEPADPDQPVSDDEEAPAPADPDPAAPEEEAPAPEPAPEEAPEPGEETVVEERSEEPTGGISVEETSETPTIASGVIPEENRGLFAAALMGLTAGLGALAYGARRVFKNKASTDH